MCCKELGILVINYSNVAIFYDIDFRVDGAYTCASPRGTIPPTPFHNQTVVTNSQINRERNNQVATQTEKNLEIFVGTTKKICLF